MYANKGRFKPKDIRSVEIIRSRGFFLLGFVLSGNYEKVFICDTFFERMCDV